jgi:hypothetical protein
MATRALSSTLPAAGALRSPLGSLGGEALIITAALGLGGGLAQASSWGRRRPGGDELTTNIALGLGGGLAAHAVSRRGQGVGPESVSSTYCRSIIWPRHLSGPELVSFTEAFSSGLLKAGEELMEREGVFTLMDLIKVVGGKPRNLRLIGGLRLRTLLISLIAARSLGCPNMRVNRGVLGRALARLIAFTFALSRGNRPQ